MCVGWAREVGVACVGCGMCRVGQEVGVACVGCIVWCVCQLLSVCKLANALIHTGCV